MYNQHHSVSSMMYGVTFPMSNNNAASQGLSRAVAAVAHDQLFIFRQIGKEIPV
jgi:hypothetical protein